MIYPDMNDIRLCKDDLLYAYSFTHHCVASKNSEEFHKHILALSDFLGFEFVLYGYIHTTYTHRHDAVIVNLTNPRDWMTEYLKNQNQNPLIDEIERQYAAGASMGYCVWDRYDWPLSKAQQQHIARRRSFGLEFGCSVFTTSEKKNFAFSLSFASKASVPDERTQAFARMIIRPLLITKKRLILQDLINSLSEKEKQVAAEAISGSSYKTIARNIGVTENTVKFHIKNIYAKLQVNNRQQVAAILLTERYLSL